MTTLCVLFAGYSINVYTDGTKAPHLDPMSEQARAGQDLFQEHNCIACHQFYGLGGYMGPDLTNVISKYQGNGIVAKSFIMNGTASMPNLGINEEEADQLVAYLEFVDQTGTYPPTDFDIKWWGAVSQADDPQ